MAALVQIMACHLHGDKPLFEAMLVSFTDAYIRHWASMSNSLTYHPIAWYNHFNYWLHAKLSIILVGFRRLFLSIAPLIAYLIFAKVLTWANYTKVHWCIQCDWGQCVNLSRFVSVLLVHMYLSNHEKTTSGDPGLFCITSCSSMMTSSNGNIFRVTGHLCGEFTGHRWIPRTKASDAELWCFLWSTPK